MMAITRTDRSLFAQWWWTVDRWSVAALLSLVAIGAMLSFAAGPSAAARYDYPQFYYVYRNLFFLLPSLVVLFAASLMTPKQVRRLAAVVFLVALVLLVLTPIFGADPKGARRWIKIGAFSLQASEFAKPGFIVLSAWLFAEHNRDASIPGHVLSGILLAIVIALLLMQPDFGQIMLVTLVWGVMFFFSGVPLKWLAVLGAHALAGTVAAYLYFPHVASRIDRFIDPSSGDTYQVDRAMEAFRTGGLVGLGPGEGQVKQYIPDAHTDFIFAVAGEEFGLVACLILVGIFFFFVTRSLLRAMNETDHFVQLASAGLVSLFGLQALINMGVNLSLLPAKGMTLPFVSYGGSSLLATSLTAGMILALTRRRGSTARACEFV